MASVWQGVFFFSSRRWLVFPTNAILIKPLLSLVFIIRIAHTHVPLSRQAVRSRVRVFNVAHEPVDQLGSVTEQLQ